MNKKKMIGSNIRPGHTPGGFSTTLVRSDAERNKYRHVPGGSGRYGRYKDVVDAANRLLGGPRFGQ